MRLQVLVSCMHETDHSLLERLNIQSDAIVVNQCDRNSVEELEYKGNFIKFLSFNERGVGLSRNTALMRADADICLFADDDVMYFEGYKDIILKSFKDNPDAGMIVFNMKSLSPDKEEYQITKKKPLRIYNSLKYGTVRLAIRRKIIIEENIFFSLLFGGGAKYSAGEDSLFISECIRKGIKVIACPELIGEVSHEKSTWFKGYNEKYFIDKGVFYHFLTKHWICSRVWATLLCLQFALRHKKLFQKEFTPYKAFKMMLAGTRKANHS